MSNTFFKGEAKIVLGAFPCAPWLRVWYFPQNAVEIDSLPSLLLIFLKCLQKLVSDLTLNGVATHSLRSPALKDGNAHAAVRKGNRQNDKDFSVHSMLCGNEDITKLIRHV